jgi:hypothetical protein
MVDARLRHARCNNATTHNATAAQLLFHVAAAELERSSFLVLDWTGEERMLARSIGTQRLKALSEG